MGSMDIGKKLQIAREEAGLSQEQLANLLGCAQSTLSNYEKGKRRLYLTQLEQIAEALGKPIDYFVKRTTPTRCFTQITNALSDEPELLQILNSLYELTQEQRRSVIDYIYWQKTRTQ
ncbi:MAG: helix-turn-helix transcriptional regulator [Syntrophomonadaceae bacterium]|nr:helix-turn-helix transcriptional regulator [Syntrophomonadaceae bacterium]MDD4549482.1 helix-turn-helix transcriptional regulator [Syntrophomonadaceae bacterium]